MMATQDAPGRPNPDLTTPDLTTPDLTTPDWTDLATRLDELADDLMAAAPAFGGELDEAAMELWSITLQHYAIQLRQKGDE